MTLYYLAKDIYFSQIYTGHPPFAGLKYTNDVQILLAAHAGVRPGRPSPTQLHSPFPDELWELTQHCWHGEAQSRPSIQYIKDEVQTPGSSSMISF